MSGWYLLYSLFQLPGGWIADRLGSKPALVLLAVLWSVADRPGGTGRRLPGAPAPVGVDGRRAGGHLPVLHEGHRRDVPAHGAGDRVRRAGVLHEPRRRPGPRDHRGSCSARSHGSRSSPSMPFPVSSGRSLFALLVPRPDGAPDRAAESGRMRSGRVARAAAHPARRQRPVRVVEARHRSADAPALLPAIPAGRRDGVLLHLVCPFLQETKGLSLRTRPDSHPGRRSSGSSAGLSAA